jgi:hypothetical protein
MSKLKAALFTLILGSSSVAMADSSVAFSAGAKFSFGTGFGTAFGNSFVAPPIVRDHRPPTYPMPPQRIEWVSLGSQSLERGRTLIRPSVSNIDALRLQATSGWSYVRRVQIRYANGSEQRLEVNRWLTRAPFELALANDRRSISSITVIGSVWGYGAKYTVSAKTTRRIEPPMPPVVQPPVVYPQPPVHPLPPVYRGYELGSGMSFLNTYGRRDLNVGADKGTFRTLHLEGETGSTYIQMVKISFANGKEQNLFAVNKMLSRGESLDLQLDGNGTYGVVHVLLWTTNDARPITTSTGTFKASLY